MTTKYMVQAAVLALLVGGAAPATAGPLTEATKAPQAYEELIGSAKAAMMANPAIALAKSGEALNLARNTPEVGDQPVKVAIAQWLEGEALLRLNRIADARPLIEQALAAAAARQPNTRLHARLMMADANVLAESGQMQKALDEFEAARRILQAVGDKRLQAMALQNIGNIYQDAGDYQKALDCLGEAIRTYSGDAVILVTAYNNRGRALKELGRYEESQAEFGRALLVSQGMDSRLLQARIRTNLASVQVLAGDLAGAEGNVAEGLKLAEADQGAREWRPYLYGVSAQIALKRGDLKAASELLARTFDHVDLAKTNMVYRDFHRTAMEVYAKLHDQRRALAHQSAFRRLDGEAHKILLASRGDP